MWTRFPTSRKLSASKTQKKEYEWLQKMVVSWSHKRDNDGYHKIKLDEKLNICLLLKWSTFKILLHSIVS